MCINFLTHVIFLTHINSLMR